MLFPDETNTENNVDRVPIIGIFRYNLFAFACKSMETWRYRLCENCIGRVFCGMYVCMWCMSPCMLSCYIMISAPDWDNCIDTANSTDNYTDVKRLSMTLVMINAAT